MIKFVRSKLALRAVSKIPVLFITYNRLDFTKKSLESLVQSHCGEIIIFDNNSTDGTKNWLKKLNDKKIKVVFNNSNVGVSGAMNYFFSITRRRKYIAKVDNDTIVEKDWLLMLFQAASEKRVDIMQAKHPILKITHPSGKFDEWMKTLERDKTNSLIFYSDHVGGTGIIIRRKAIKEELRSNWVLGGWDVFQSEHPELKKAFFTGTKLGLLDTYEGGTNYKKYEGYYKKTGRL